MQLVETFLGLARDYGFGAVVVAVLLAVLVRSDVSVRIKPRRRRR